MWKREFSVPLFTQLVNNVPKSKKESKMELKEQSWAVNAKAAMLDQATADLRPNEDPNAK